MARGGKAPGKARTPVGYGAKGHPFYNLKNYNQSKVGQKKGNPNPGTKGNKIVGYGAKGKPFYNLAKFNQSKVGQGKATAGTPKPQSGGKGLHGGIPGGRPPKALSAGSGSAARNPVVPKIPGSYHGLTSGAGAMKNAGRGPAGI